MSICLDPSRRNSGAGKSCDTDCLAYENEACLSVFMTQEIRELYDMLVSSRKKVDVLVQLNNYLTDVLNTETQEVF